MRRLLRFLFLMPFMIGSVLLVSTPAHADYDPTQVEKSVVWVEIHWHAEVWAPAYWFNNSDTPGYFEEEADAYWECTGWFVSNEGDLVTAGHCVEMDQEVKDSLIDDLADKFGYSNKLRGYAHDDWQIRKGHYTRDVTVGQPQGVAGSPLEDDSITAQVVAFQRFDNGDNALLRVADIVSVGMPLSTTPLEINDTVTSVGFPGSVSDVSDIRRQRASFKNGSVSSRQYTDNGVPNTEIDAVVSAGMSGGANHR